MAGAKPSFGDSHIIHALFNMRDRKTSRSELINSLGIGEGSVKTILTRLKKKGFVDSSNTGHWLSERGIQKIKDLEELFTAPAALDSDDMISGASTGFCIIRGKAGMISGNGTAETLIGLMQGATACVILVKSGGKLVFPGESMGLDGYQDTVSELETRGIREDDAVVLACSNCWEKTANALISVCLELQVEKVSV